LCKPDTVELHFEAPQGPDSVAWLLEDGTQDLTPEFSWSPECPFATMDDSPTARRIEGTDNKKKEGNYKYTIVLKNAQGKAVAELDPWIQNQRL
jgi:hypothetical protein